MTPPELWERYKKYRCVVPDLGLEVDVSRMWFEDNELAAISDSIAAAMEAMAKLERGVKANVDEDRMVGHYWLRAPKLAPNEDIRKAIEQSVSKIKSFAQGVHDGTITPQRGDGFFVVLVIGIGGSVLGTTLVCSALETTDDAMVVRFLDNTDPDGIDVILAELEETLDQTLVLVVSKSGTTVETNNAMAEVSAAYKRAKLPFAKHAVAITCEGSKLFQKSQNENWLDRFPIWDWVGGRTSATSAVGLLPLALQGGDIDALLSGAADCDIATREPNLVSNPAALLAATWFLVGKGVGQRNLVCLPYRDRLSNLGRYLQQLVMESIGKHEDRSGKQVQQGLTVYGHKGTTDQHSFVQQLRDGADDFFAVFVEILTDRDGDSPRVAANATSGDFLHAFMRGMRDALSERDRQSITITLEKLNARTLGALIALFERTVGIYAELIDVNAYNQPGVEAGKASATDWIELQGKVLEYLKSISGEPATTEQIAAAINRPSDVENIWHILRHAAANDDHGVVATDGTDPTLARFRLA